MDRNAASLAILTMTTPPDDNLTPEIETSPGEDPPAARRETDTFSPLVAEIRQRLSAIASREVALQRRERELEQESERIARDARLSVQVELEDARERLKHRSTELDAHAIELSNRQNRLAQIESRLTSRAQGIERDREKLAAALGRLRRRRTDDRARRGNERLEHEKRLAEVRRIERDLHQRVMRAHSDINSERDALKELREQLEQRGTELDEQQSRIESSVADLEPERADIERRRAALSRDSAGLDTRAADLAKERETLRQRQQEVDDDWRRTRELRDQLTQRGDEIDQDRHKLQRERDALDERESRVVVQEEHLRDEAETIAARRTDLRALESSMESRRQSLDELADRVAASERAADQRLESVHELHEETAARDAEVRQTALTLELQADQLETERQRVERQFEELQAQQMAAAIEAEIPARAARLRRPVWIAPLVAAVFAAIAGLASWYTQPQMTRTTMRLAITTEGHDPQKVTQGHADRMEEWAVGATIADPTSNDYWHDAESTGRLRVLAPGPETDVEVSLVGPRPELHTDLLRTTLLDPYAEAVNGVPAEPQLPPMYADLVARRQQVESEAATVASEIETCQAKIALLPEASDRAALAAEVEALRTAQVAAAEKIHAQRAEIRRLIENPPKAEVAPEAVDEALSRDPVYLQDRTEFATAAETYRRELGVALLMLDEPLEQTLAALRQLGSTVTEQLELEPPPTIATVLDDLKTDIARVTQALTKLTENSVAWRAALERMGSGGEDVVSLVTLHNAAIEDVRHAVDGATELATTVERRAAGLEASADGGTRHVVVAAVLRGDGRPLVDHAAGLGTTATAVTFEGNIELDAQNRRMRSLRGQLNRRRGILERQMQAAADQMVSDAHDQGLLEARAVLRELEDARETHLLRLSEKVDALHDVDERLLERRGLEVELATWQKEAARLAAQLGKLDDQMTEVRRNATHPDRVAVIDEPATHDLVAGENRARNTSLVAGGTFVVMCVTCLLLTGHNPLAAFRRRDAATKPPDDATPPNE